MQMLLALGKGQEPQCRIRLLLKTSVLVTDSYLLLYQQSSSPGQTPVYESHCFSCLHTPLWMASAKWTKSAKILLH